MSEFPRILALGLLTQQDLNLLGKSFDRVFPMDGTEGFEDLLQAIDESDRQLQAGREQPAS